jgi:hypothetical protein
MSFQVCSIESSEIQYKTNILNKALFWIYTKGNNKYKYIIYDERGNIKFLLSYLEDREIWEKIELWSK